MKINLNKCRVCFENIGIIPFFQEHEDEIVSEMISSLFNINVIYNENLPTTICSNCLENIKLCFLTKTIIVNSESMLSIYLKSKVTIGESAKNLNQIKVEDEDPVVTSDLIGLDAEDIKFERPGCSSRDFEDKQSAGFQIINVQSLTSSNPQTTPTVSSKLYDCEFCEFRAVTYKRLNSHKRIHPEAVRIKEEYHKGRKHSPDVNNPKRVTCTFCGRKLSIYSIQRHVRFTHFGERPFSCSYCHKSFSRSDNLTSHMQVHFNSKDNSVVDPQKKQFYLKHKCDECDKAFANTTLLKLHKVGHSRVRAHVCPHCGLEFKLKVILKRHVRLFHIIDEDDPKNFTCKSCGNVSTNLTELKLHFSTHTDHKPFKCNFCDVRFVYGKSLRKHIATQHIQAKKEGKETRSHELIS